MNKTRSKGKEDHYEELSMAEYLLPLNKTLSMPEKQRLFAVKTRMTNIPANFPKPETEYKCQCRKKEKMEHVFDCEILKAQINVEQNNASKATNKLEHVEKVASQKIVESMPGATFEEDSNHLAMLLATVLRNDDFEYDEVSDKVEPKSSYDFLKRIEHNCPDIPDKEENLSLVKTKYLIK